MLTPLVLLASAHALLRYLFCLQELLVFHQFSTSAHALLRYLFRVMALLGALPLVENLCTIHLPYHLFKFYVLFNIQIPNLRDIRVLTGAYALFPCYWIGVATSTVVLFSISFVATM
ncbi:hypothetical protein VNI00_017767 [Paramarasmius palmivorus]|uniref:Uncharacterized protein n=1 Tax=Paramarasmius palmivorus TaxID=297713 RepID=A0AAW0B367_9AGAR